jgi:glycosyltransferase involved in cell wall biosynthesis
MLTGAYHPEISSGAAYCRQLIGALSDQVSFAVLTTVREGSLPRQDRVDGVPVWRVPAGSTAVWDRLRGFVMLVVALLAHLRHYRVVHVNGFSLKSILAILAAKATGKRVLLALHTAGQDEPSTQRALPLGRLRLFAYRRADRYVAVSPALAARYLADGLPASRLVHITNGVDTTRFRPAADAAEAAALRAHLGLPRDLPVVLFVGFFSADKGPHRALEAWRRACARGARSALVLIGATDHPEADPELVAGIRQCQVAPGGEDLHLVERAADIEAYYRAADIFVLPSVREACPLALLEAMASGLACLTFRPPGATDVLVGDGVSGVLAPPNDIDALAAALEALPATLRAGRRSAAGRASPSRPSGTSCAWPRPTARATGRSSRVRRDEAGARQLVKG